jgi:transcriptional regulator with XRE-family HTH domain
MRLRKERKAAGLTQSELARLAGVTQGHISKLERGERFRPSFEILQSICGVLQRRGRRVEPIHIQPRNQPALIKGFRAQPKQQRKGAA